MRYPAGYAEVLESMRSAVESGAVTSDAAIKLLAAEIEQDATAWADHDLSVAIARGRAAASKSAAVKAAGQEELYPELAVIYKVTPGKSRTFGDFTLHDCETALRVIDNQRQDRELYLARVQEVRPFLGDGKTVREIWPDVLRKREAATS